MAVVRAIGDRRTSRLAVTSWVLFDWATQPFFTVVTTFVFAPYFAAHVARTPVEGQALWGYATAAAGLTIALLSPILGAIADAGGARKPWVAAFSLLLIGGSLALWPVAPGVEGAVALALVAFAIATIGVEFATVFTNAMMPDLVEQRRLGRLSGLGWGVGYVGGLVSLAIMLTLMVADPGTGKTLIGTEPIFGLDATQNEGDRASGPFAAIWYVVFALPLFLFTPDTPRRMAFGPAIRSGLASIKATVIGLRGHANAARFLFANMIYKDGLVALFAFGGIYASGMFGWSAIELGVFGILITTAGVFGSLVGGWLDDKIGPKQVILIALVMLTISSIGILSVDKTHIAFFVPVTPPQAGDALFAGAGEIAYLVLGAIIGAAAGPLQASSRTLMVALSPARQMTEFFGLFALSGKITSFVGPFAVSTVTVIAQSQRIGMAVLLVFFVVGALMLATVRSAKG